MAGTHSAPAASRRTSARLFEAPDVGDLLFDIDQIQIAAVVVEPAAQAGAGEHFDSVGPAVGGRVAAPVDLLGAVSGPEAVAVAPGIDETARELEARVLAQVLGDRERPRFARVRRVGRARIVI